MGGFLKVCCWYLVIFWFWLLRWVFYFEEICFGVLGGGLCVLVYLNGKWMCCIEKYGYMFGY